MQTREFCDAVDALLEDASFPDENTDTRRFLEAMAAWLRDTKGGSGFFEQHADDAISWRDLLLLLQAAAEYE
jgi:hypothetical protein